MLKLQLFRESDCEVILTVILYMLFYRRKVIYMIGVIVNTVAVLIGSGIGLLLKKGTGKMDGPYNERNRALHNIYRNEQRL